ncbi:MAG TPA: ATP-binding protein [Vicinamibacteria bacterium]|nr:ATP-binding protein [Vicinamibacteria bacterium]
MDLQDSLVAAVLDLSLAHDLDALTATVRTAARHLTGADGVTFVLREQGFCHYVDEDAIEPLWKGRRFAIDECISGWVMKNRRPAAIGDIYADPRVPHDAYRSTFVKSLAVVPVRPEDPIAAIGAYWARPHQATEGELATLQALANAAALALANVALYDELERRIDAEREARQAAEAANRTKDEILSILSHELRSPLNVIRGWVWQLKQPNATPQTVQRAAEVIERNTAAQTRLVEDLLDAQRAMSGRLQLNPRLLDLAEICRTVVELATPAAQAKGLRLHMGRGLPCIVWGDPDRLQQVVWNVVSNAVKFTPDGGQVWLAVGRGERRICVEVRDSGVGIEPELLPHVFEPFRQGDSSSTRRHGGLGLGLAIARQLVELHGGEVRAESAGPHKGTTVTIELPVPALLEEPAPWPGLRAGSDHDAPSLQGLSVLVVDDEQEAGEAVRRLLEMHGATVSVERSARDALARLERESPDVLISDIAMPGMDGFDLIQQVRASPARSHTVPAAALTAFSGPEIEEKVRRAGFQTFVPKPVAPEDLASTVARLAARRRGH